ncbi:nucleic acid/nucleotide deaminase domain-containing protein [Aspergillus tubingensis]|uniref:nucleic acid/nucleotide deaminase domain-containing protein n=1 Tax=Aspergillus tubingensis TaxID=5068 RepID=UPI001578B725|nr:amidohydrolase family protein [Aspergillus tubingensis]GFN20181.1 amidohydrolase family protein [Aspergillus tubingensis]
MSHDPPGDPPMSHSPRRLRRLYEPLSLLQTLGNVRGWRIRAPDIPQDYSGFNAIKSHRSFVDALAYACAYKKEPAYVTAVALEKRPEEIVVWLAANKNVEDNVVGFAQDVLIIVQWLARNPSAQLGTEDGQQALNLLTSRVLRFNAPKIYAYYEQLMRAAPQVIAKLSNGQHEGNPNVANLKHWLSQHLQRDGLQLQEVDMAKLAVISHNSRDTFEVLRNIAMESHDPHPFERLFKLLGKLGKHVIMSKRIVEGAIFLRSDFARGMRLERVPASPELPLPFSSRKYNIDGISNRMFSSNSAEKQRFLARLRTIWDTSEWDKNLAKKHLAGESIVHAELLILDHFEKTGGDFLDNSDKYIGCSKPACYLCYHYICNHPGRYIRPSSHQKLYMRWRLPDISITEPNAATRFKDQEQILNNLINLVRRELRNDIETGVGKMKGCPDSTAGGTSTMFELETGLEADMGSLSFQELRHQIDPDLQYVVIPDPVSSSSSASSIHSRSSADTAVSGGDEVEYDSDGGVVV